MSSIQIIWVSPSKIDVNPNQPRREFAEVDLEELAESLKSVGFIHPPTVRKHKNGDHYELISGERRWRAAQKAGIDPIPVMEVGATHLESLEMALVENIQRVDLNPIEIALSLRALENELHLQQSELGKKIGKQRSTVANYLRLLSLPFVIQDSVRSGEISMGHAKTLLSVENEQDRIAFWREIKEKNYSVRAAEKKVHSYSSKKKSSKSKTTTLDADILAIQEKLEEALGTKVSIVPSSNQQGKIVIDYYNLDDVDRILQIILQQ